MQGLTEFLPVSSSGHLVLAQSFLGFTGQMLFFDLLLHAGTLAAIVVVYRRDIYLMVSESIKAISQKSFENLPNARFTLMVIIGTVPVAIIGTLFEEHFERLFASPLAVGFMLIITGTFLFLTSRASPGKTDTGNVSVKHVLLIGLVQSLALTPGISRSGITIAAALFLGLEREAAARFSFILSIPAIMGAVFLKSLSSPIGDGNALIYASGTVAAFLVGTAALLWLIKIVRKGKISHFAWYCWAVGIAAIFLNS